MKRRFQLGLGFKYFVFDLRGFIRCAIVGIPRFKPRTTGTIKPNPDVGHAKKTLAPTCWI